MIEDEQLSSGAVPGRIYVTFIVSAVVVIVVFTMLAFIVGQAFQMASNVFLSKMVNEGLAIKISSVQNNATVC